MAATYHIRICVCVYDVCVKETVCSRSAALDESRVEADISDVMSVQQPGEETLQTQTVTTMRACAILPLKHTKTHKEASYFPFITF